MLLQSSEELGNAGKQPEGIVAVAFAIRGYQSDLIEQARDAIRRGSRSPLLVLPTGGGKTAISADVMGSAARRGRKSVFVVHRRELVIQTSRTFDKVGIEHGIIAAGFRPSPHASVQIASIQTLARRALPWSPDMLVFDEAHHVASETWDQLFAKHPRAVRLGVTATPMRLDGRGLGDWFDEMIEGPTVRWLIEQGYLSNYKIFAPSTPDMSGVKTRAGDWATSEVANRMDRPAITGDAIEHYRKLCDGARAIVFATNIEHSQHIVEQFRAAGYPAAHLDGKTDRAVRDATLAEFASGKIRILSNVDLFGEGFDVPAIEAVILLRPTQSTGLYLQQVGRGLRPAEGKKHAIILDHAGNALRHGMPDEIREWNLDPVEKRKRAPTDELPIKQCPECFAVHDPQPVCPNCGHEYEVKRREIEQRDGVLVELSEEMIKRQRKKEQGSAKSLEDLIALATARQYKNPAAWARHVYSARQRRAG